MNTKCHILMRECPQKNSIFKNNHRLVIYPVWLEKFLQIGSWKRDLGRGHSVPNLCSPSKLGAWTQGTPRGCLYAYWASIGVLQYTGAISGTFPGFSRENPGKIPGDRRENPGKVPGKSRENPGKVPGKSRESPGKIPGKSRENPKII